MKGLAEVTKEVALMLPQALRSLSSKYQNVLLNFERMQEHEYCNPLVVKMLIVAVILNQDDLYNEEYFADQFKWYLMDDIFKHLQWDDCVMELEKKTIEAICWDFEEMLIEHGIEPNRG